MDYEKDFWETVRATIEMMKQRKTGRQTFKSSSGQIVHGWLVERYAENTDGKGPGGSPLERWHNELLLGDDAQFYWYSVEWSHWEGEKTTLSVTDYGLVGDSGKPFSQMKEKIERLPYLN